MRFEIFDGESPTDGASPRPPRTLDPRHSVLGRVFLSTSRPSGNTSDADTERGRIVAAYRIQLLPGRKFLQVFRYDFNFLLFGFLIRYLPAIVFLDRSGYGTE